MSKLYYIQDTSCTVGNLVLWWRPDCKGYTTDLNKAGLYPEATAMALHKARRTDIPRLKEEVDSISIRAVDTDDFYPKFGWPKSAGTGLCKICGRPDCDLSCDDCG